MHGYFTVSQNHLTHQQRSLTGNVFLDHDQNIRLGDFGLATKHREKHGREGNKQSDVDNIYDEIEDISRLIGDPMVPSRGTSTISAEESMTG